MENCEVMTSSPHSFAYSYRLVKKCFLKICETSKCHNFLIFQPIFIRFSLLYLKNFTLSSEIKLNLLWSSSLKYLLKLIWQIFLTISDSVDLIFFHVGWKPIRLCTIIHNKVIHKGSKSSVNSELTLLFASNTTHEIVTLLIANNNALVITSRALSLYI